MLSHETVVRTFSPRESVEPSVHDLTGATSTAIARILTLDQFGGSVPGCCYGSRTASGQRAVRGVEKLEDLRSQDVHAKRLLEKGRGAGRVAILTDGIVRVA